MLNGLLPRFSQLTRNARRSQGKMRPVRGRRAGRAAGRRGFGLRAASAVIFALCMLAAVLDCGLAAAAVVAVTGARVSAEGNRATFELSLSARASFRLSTLADPPRIVIDLESARWQIGDDALPRATGPIAAVRLGRPKPDLARLVIDCNQPTKIESSRLKRQGNGYALALQLVGKKPPPPVRLQANKRLPAGTEIGAVPPSKAAALMPPPRRPAAEPRDGSARKYVVVLDAGHGGGDPGAISGNQLYEKRVTLAAAKEIKAALTALGPYRVVTTRSRDVYLPLRDRVAFARRAGADLFVSIHADKVENRAVRGLSVYTLSERASDAEAAALAERENKADLIADLDLRGATPEVTNILIDLAQRQTKNDSARLAGALLTQLRGEAAILPRPHRFAGFAVLKAPDVPSVLIELGFLSNEADEEMLSSAKGRQRVVRAIARGVDAYFTSVELARDR